MPPLVVTTRLILLLALICSLSCSRPRYLPDITLTPENRIIDATAELHDFYLKPALVSGKETFGLEGPGVKEADPRELVVQVEGELLRAFQASGMFTRVTRFDPQPDVILTGRINALYEHYRPQVWTYVPGLDTMTKILRLKSHASSGQASLTLFVLRPTGEVLGTYRGKATFRETFNPTDSVPPGARLNRALSEAVQQIHDQVVRDAQVRRIASR